MSSPVCVPPVGKLHQQHELDEEENEPADGAYIAPHCGSGRREEDAVTHHRWDFGPEKSCSNHLD